MLKPAVDFNRIDPRHRAVDARLVEWAKWVRVTPRLYSAQPLFRQYRSHAWQWERPEVTVAPDPIAAMEVEKTMRHLPQTHRDVLVWCYVYPQVPPAVARKEIGLTYQDMIRIKDNALDMVNNLLKQREVV